MFWKVAFYFCSSALSEVILSSVSLRISVSFCWVVLSSEEILKRAAPYAYTPWRTQGRQVETRVWGAKSLGMEMLLDSRLVGWKRVELMVWAIYFRI